MDGTDFRVPEPYPFEEGWSERWFSHKFLAAALRYEIAISITEPKIVWINGPFPAGMYNDHAIFCGGLLHNLDDGERVEADDGYWGSDPLFTRCRSSKFHATEGKESRGAVRARHETVNRLLTQFQILNQKFRHDLTKHATAFRAVAVIAQLKLHNDPSLFDVPSYSANN